MSIPKLCLFQTIEQLNVIDLFKVSDVGNLKPSRSKRCYSGNCNSTLN
jgi:hypothetical protein